MAEVALSIGGRRYRLTCRDGDEPRLLATAAVLDARAAELTAALGNMPETRLLLMTALTVAGSAAPVPDLAAPAPDLAELAAAVESAEALAARLEAALAAPPARP